MIGSKETMRNDPRPNYTYQDRVFDNEISHAVQVTDEHYENMLIREAVKSGFYDLQVGRSCDCHVTSSCVCNLCHCL